MPEIIPAILPKSYEDLKNRVALVRHLAPLVQVDICDGRYVKSTTWPFSSGKIDAHFESILNEREGLPFWEDIDFELDLMVRDGMENFDIYSKLGARRLVFHLGANDAGEFADFLEGIDPYVKDNMEIGIAASLGAGMEDIFKAAVNADFVQVMGIRNVGFQGEEFDQECLEYIRTLKERFPDMPVSVDGGVNLNTAKAILDAGADRLVIDSAIFNADDIIGTIEEFRNL